MSGAAGAARPTGARDGASPPSTAGPTLAINAQRLLGPRAGVGRYLSELLRRWAAAELPFAQVTLYAPAPIPRDALPAEHSYRLAVVPGRGPAGAWEHIALPRAAAGASVLFCPSYVVPPAWRGAAVVTIHDVMQEVVAGTFPWYSRAYRARLYRLAARRASVVLTDSESSKRDIERIYGVPGPRVRAVALGVDPAFATATEEDERRVRERLGLVGPLVLFVGKFSRRRNLPTLVRAFARAQRGGACDATLVLVGSDHLGLALDRLGEELDLGSALRLPGHVADEDLPALYRAATVFAYPSDYEGFGLPPLEAMAAGTPVLALDSSSVAEVVGDAGVLLPAATEEGLAHALERLLCDPALRERYAREGSERAKRYTWEATAGETLAALCEAAGLQPLALAEGGPLGGDPTSGEPAGVDASP